MRMNIGQAVVLGVAVMLAGCQTVTVGGNSAGLGLGDEGMQGLNGSVDLGGPPVVMPQENDSTLDPNDPCVNNLENLTGALLQFAGEKHHLPGALSELPTTFAGEKISLSCPVDGKPYMYYPDGLRAPPELAPRMVHQNGSPVEGNLLILVDADAAHTVTQRLTDGKKSWSVKKQVRYGIVMEPPGGSQAVKMYVIPVEQALLDMYLKEQRRDQSGLVRQVAPGGAF